MYSVFVELVLVSTFRVCFVIVFVSQARLHENGIAQIQADVAALSAVRVAGLSAIITAKETELENHRVALEGPASFGLSFTECVEIFCI